VRRLLQIQMESIMPDLKVARQRDLKGGSYRCALIFKPSRLLIKGKLRTLAKAFCLSKSNLNFNGM
jgi:hypothetical protein